LVLVAQGDTAGPGCSAIAGPGARPPAARPRRGAGVCAARVVFSRQPAVPARDALAGAAGWREMGHEMANPVHTALLYHFCRLRRPAIALPLPVFESHLQRAFELSRAKHIRKGEATSWESFLENLHAVDWFLACACLEGRPSAWEVLFAARANRTDSLLV